jgi:hypothetical protein
MVPTCKSFNSRANSNTRTKKLRNELFVLSSKAADGVMIGMGVAAQKPHSQGRTALKERKRRAAWQIIVFVLGWWERLLLPDVRTRSFALSELCGSCHRYPGFRKASTLLSPVTAFAVENSHCSGHVSHRSPITDHQSPSPALPFRVGRNGERKIIDCQRRFFDSFAHRWVSVNRTPDIFCATAEFHYADHFRN